MKKLIGVKDKTYKIIFISIAIAIAIVTFIHSASVVYYTHNLDELGN
jgi:hypothetical protein